MHLRNLTALALGLVAAAATPTLADDHADVVALIHEYARTEDFGDLVSQDKLMSPERVFLETDTGRRLDHAKNMEIQKKTHAAAEQAGSTTASVSEARDIDIRLHADGKVAIASFYWYVTPLGNVPPTTPTLVSHVLEKGDGWKIVHTHISPLYTN